MATLEGEGQQCQGGEGEAEQDDTGDRQDFQGDLTQQKGKPPKHVGTSRSQRGLQQASGWCPHLFERQPGEAVWFWAGHRSCKGGRRPSLPVMSSGAMA